MIKLNEPLCNKMSKQAQRLACVVSVLLHNTTLRRQRKSSSLKQTFHRFCVSSLPSIKRVRTCAHICESTHMCSCLCLVNAALPVRLCDILHGAQLKPLPDKMLSISLSKLCSFLYLKLSLSSTVYSLVLPFCFFLFKASNCKRKIWLRKICRD